MDKEILLELCKKRMDFRLGKIYEQGGAYRCTFIMEYESKDWCGYKFAPHVTDFRIEKEEYNQLLRQKKLKRL